MSSSRRPDFATVLAFTILLLVGGLVLLVAVHAILAVT